MSASNRSSTRKRLSYSRRILVSYRGVVRAHSLVLKSLLGLSHFCVTRVLDLLQSYFVGGAVLIPVKLGVHCLSSSINRLFQIHPVCFTGCWLLLLGCHRHLLPRTSACWNTLYGSCEGLSNLVLVRHHWRIKLEDEAGFSLGREVLASLGIRSSFYYISSGVLVANVLLYLVLENLKALHL